MAHVLVYYVISRYRSSVQRIFVFMKNAGSRAHNFHQCKKMSLRLYCYINFLIYQYLPHDLQSTLTRVNNNTFLILNGGFFLYFQTNISQISQISAIRKKTQAQNFK